MCLLTFYLQLWAYSHVFASFDESLIVLIATIPYTN